MTSAKLDSVLIDTTTGPIRGYIDEENHTKYYKFKKIPFAKPPLGPLRFLPPVPVTPWTEVLDCTHDAPLPLFRYQKIALMGSEDCLYIELSTKNLKPINPLPVMFWIGSFMFSSHIDHLLDHSLINDHDVIFVRCGFRVGALGFLSVNDFTAPGNCGLKDIVMALKWIQNNIDKFGGDPNNITLFGSGSGSSAIHLMMLSPMASGLFHKAILQSSTALNNWSLTKNPSQSVVDLAKKLGITTSLHFEIVEELRSVPAEQLVTASCDLQDELFFPDWNTFDAYFKPCIENDLEGLPAFLTKSPILILRSGNFNKVPVIIGSNNIEASFIKFIQKDFYQDYQKYNDDISLIVPRSLSCDNTLTKDIALKLLDFYLIGERSLTEKTQTQFLQFLSDYYFIYYINKTVRLHNAIAPEYPVFYYILNCAGEWDIPEHLSCLNNLGHCAEMPFIFGIKSDDSQVCKGSRDSVKTRSRVIKMWTNFAKYGNPTPDKDDPLLQIEWESVKSEDKLNYLSIGTELTKGKNPFQERMKFWDNLHKEYTFQRMLSYFNDLGVTW